MWKYESRAKKLVQLSCQLEKPVDNNKKQQFYSSVGCRVRLQLLFLFFIFINSRLGVTLLTQN